MRQDILSMIDWDLVESAFEQSPNAVKLHRPNANPKQNYPHILLRFNDNKNYFPGSTVIGPVISHAPDGLFQRNIIIMTRGSLRLEKIVTLSPEENALIDDLLKRIDDNDSYVP